MKSLFNAVVGRKRASPLLFRDRANFLSFLERNARRIDSRAKLQVPLLSRQKGFVFFEDKGSLTIRHNSQGIISTTSLCYFSGKIERHDGVNKLVGYFRFPWFVEVPKYLVLIFAIVWIFYFANRIVFQSPLPAIDWIVGILGLGFFGLAGAFFGNVSASFLALNLMRKVDSLLAGYRES
ncbi:MAG: hypothetical protein AAF668_13480 [Pseudomonadota bacterium]